MTPPAPALSSLSRYLENRFAAAGAFLLLSLLMTFPLVLHFRSAVPAGSGDIWQNYWNLWWWKKALLELHQHPYFTQYLFHPTGADLIFHTHSSFNMLLALPVTATLGPGAAYNFCVLLALWLSGFGAYLFVRDLTGDARAGFLAGLVFAYFPHHMEQMLEHLNLFSIQFIPLTLFFFFRLCREGGWVNIAGTGICFAFNTLCSWHLGLKLILVLLVLGIVQVVRRPRPVSHLAHDTALAAVVAGIVLWPAVEPLFAEMTRGDRYYQKEAQNLGVDPVFLLIPQYEHPLWGPVTSRAYVDKAYGAAGFMSYVGIVPLAMAFFAFYRKRPGSTFWGVFTAGSLVFALGAHPYWDGHLFENITLPFAVFERLPIFSLLRVGNRFMTVVSLGLAVLVAFGWMALRRKTDLAFCIAASLVLLDYAWLPFPIRQVEISPIYHQMASSGRTGAVIDVPSMQRSRATHNMVAQTVHNHPIADGYVSTSEPEAEAFIQQDRALSDLIGVPRLERPLDRAHLLALGFDTFVLHKYRTDSYAEQRRAAVPRHHITEWKQVSRLGGVPDETMQRLHDELTAGCGEPVFEDDQIVVFYLDRRPGGEPIE